MDLEMYAPTIPDIYGNAPGYYDAGFLFWQHSIDKASQSQIIYIRKY